MKTEFFWGNNIRQECIGIKQQYHFIKKIVFIINTPKTQLNIVHCT